MAGAVAVLCPQAIEKHVKRSPSVDTNLPRVEHGETKTRFR
jgi:hypothetical protein